VPFPSFLAADLPLPDVYNLAPPVAFPRDLHRTGAGFRAQFFFLTFFFFPNQMSAPGLFSPRRHPSKFVS